MPLKDWWESEDHQGWFYHSPRREEHGPISLKALTRSLDEALESLAVHLDRHGYRTLPSCEGHYHRPSHYADVFRHLEQDAQKIRGAGLRLSNCESGEPFVYRNADWKLPFTREEFMRRASGNDEKPEGYLAFLADKEDPIVERLPKVIDPIKGARCELVPDNGQVRVELRVYGGSAKAQRRLWKDVEQAVRKLTGNRTATAGWEPREVPDQLFAGKRNTDRDFRYDPVRVNPVIDAHFNNKPQGGLWTSDYDAARRSSPWLDWMQSEQENWVPEEGTVLRVSDPERLRMYTIDTPDDYERLVREYPGLTDLMEMPQVDWKRLFGPQAQGGAGAQMLRVTQEGLDENYEPLRLWDVPSSVWGDPDVLQEVERIRLERNMQPWRSQGLNNPEAARETLTRLKREAMKTSNVMQKIVRVAHELDKAGRYAEADTLTGSLVRMAEEMVDYTPGMQLVSGQQVRLDNTDTQGIQNVINTGQPQNINVNGQSWLVTHGTPDGFFQLPPDKVDAFKKEWESGQFQNAQVKEDGSGNLFVDGPTFNEVVKGPWLSCHDALGNATGQAAYSASPIEIGIQSDAEGDTAFIRSK